MSASQPAAPAAAPIAAGAADPASVYDGRLRERREEVERWRRIEGTVSVSRLVMMAAALVLAWLAVQSRLLAVAWAVLPAVGFVALVLLHEPVLRRLGRARRAVAFYRQGLARLSDDWVGTGESGERHLDPHHPYAADLDLFGRGSLYELLCLARTRSGEDTLARWLLEPARRREVESRQQAVAELRDRLDFREDLSALGTEVRSALDPEPLRDWADGPPRLRSRFLRPLLLVLATANVLAAGGWAAGLFGPAPLLALGLIEVVGHLFLRREVAAVVKGVDRASRDLALLAELLRRIESEPLTCPRLSELRERLGSDSDTSGEQIARLQKLADLLDSRRNAFFAPFALLLLWTSQLACAVETWRRRSGAAVSGWLEVVGEMETLASLAAYAYEHPQDPFPELLADTEPRLEASGLGHPLLPVAGCVRNDLELGGGERRALVVSGSNMSGKSTLLRTTGTAVVMALAGAPVRARALKLTPLQVGASIRVQDSLQAGASRFYAEITRLRQILELTAGELGVLFLLDEILHGTNSHDRRIGAEAVVRAFVERGAIGLVTTHDLALARIAEPPGRFDNVHFEDYLEAGKIRFDYRLRPGVVEHSNALALMREVGLEV